MAGDDILGIGDHLVEIGGLGAAVPVVVLLGSTPQVSLGQEMGRGALGNLTHLGGIVRELVERGGEVGFDQVEDLGLGGTLELEGHAGGRLGLDRHAAELGQQVEIVQAADEVGDAGVDVRIGSGVGAVLNAGDHRVGRVDTGVHIVPEGTGVDGVGVDHAADRGEAGAVVVPHAVGVVGTDGILVRTVVQEAVARLGAMVVAEVGIQTDDKLVKTLVGLKVIGVAGGGEFLFEEFLVAGDRDDHRNGQHTGEDIFVHFHNPKIF